MAKDESWVTPHDYYTALAYTVRDRLLPRWIDTVKTYIKTESKVVFYLSAEFLMGRQLANNLINLGLYEKIRLALQELGQDLNDLSVMETEQGETFKSWIFFGLKVKKNYKKVRLHPQKDGICRSPVPTSRNCGRIYLVTQVASYLLSGYVVAL